MIDELFSISEFLGLERYEVIITKNNIKETLFTTNDFNIAKKYCYKIAQDSKEYINIQIYDVDKNAIVYEYDSINDIS